MLSKLPVYAEQFVTYQQIINCFEELLDEDLDDCIERGFDKLDIRDDKEISISLLKQALQSSYKLNTKKAIKS